MSFNLDQHIRDEHHINPFTTYLKEIVYGGTDGIITTFAIVAGFTGAQAGVTAIPMTAVLLFGFANLAADGISMALGNFLSTRSEQDVYQNFKTKEREELLKNPEQEKAESIEILQRKGFSQTQAEKLVAIYATNEKYWLDFMMEKELELPNPEKENPIWMATVTFVSFISFGFIPLLPYVLIRENGDHFYYSGGAALVALITLGLLRLHVTKQHWLRSLSETIILGTSAALVAYLVGTMFRV